MKPFYITTTLPYVNASPHIGFALEIIQADVIARYKRLMGYDVFFNFGTDEHGQKIYTKALEQKKDPQKYVDEYALQFDNLKKALDVSYDNFIRTTDKTHVKAAQEMWIRCMKNGYIKKGIYTTKYCMGCELEKQESDLQDGLCPIHPNMQLDERKEENYFFTFSKFQQKLLDLYNNNPKFVVPNHRLQEIINFVSSGLSDFSISRLKEKMPWGIEVPGDSKHVMYVWFDALVNYISALGWPDDVTTFEHYWGTSKKPLALQIAGKDNLRQQSAMWQAMLMAARLPQTRQIFIHGFITSNGQKMSKSLGNVIDPYVCVKKYGTDALRFYLLRELSSFEDGDFTDDKMVKLYNSELANELGNLVSRVAKMAQGLDFAVIKNNFYDKKIGMKIESFCFDQALIDIWDIIRKINKYINEKEPWNIPDNTQKTTILQIAVDAIRKIAFLLTPFLPSTSSKITKQFKGKQITRESLLFERIS